MENKVFEALRTNTKIAVHIPRREGKTTLLRNIALTCERPVIVLVVTKRSCDQFILKDIRCATYGEQDFSESLVLCDDADNVPSYLLPINSGGALVMTFSDLEWVPPIGTVILE
jgi:hypothetical protein